MSYPTTHPKKGGKKKEGWGVEGEKKRQAGHPTMMRVGSETLCVELGVAGGPTAAGKQFVFHLSWPVLTRTAPGAAYPQLLSPGTHRASGRAETAGLF